MLYITSYVTSSEYLDPEFSIRMRIDIDIWFCTPL